MKIQCDVCGVEQAAVLCCADEAALCSGCDGRIHSANKLAGKHRRFSLLNSSSRPLPLCDICKEKSGFLFCQEDRAILCRECDVPIHTATAHAGRHSRFLLTGIRLSFTPISHSSPSVNEVVSNSSSGVEEEVSSRTAAAKSKDGGGSSISDYLMKMLPGWRVDDFLFDDPAAVDGDTSAGFFQAQEAPPVATVPWFAPVNVNSPAAVAAQPELQWRSMFSSEDGSRSRWSEEDVSTVPELNKIHCEYINNERSKASLWF